MVAVLRFISALIAPRRFLPAAGFWWETETWVINELARQCGHHF